MDQETKEKTIGILLGIIGGVALAAYLEYYLERKYKVRDAGFRYTYKIIILELIVFLVVFLCWAFLAWSGKI